MVAIAVETNNTQMKLFGLVLIMLCFIGCSTSLKKDVLIKNMTRDSWNENVNFKFINSDTISKRDIVFLFRYDETFEYEKMRFLFSVTSPKGDMFCDTMAFDVKSHDVKYITILEHEQELINSVRLDSGVYYFNIKPLMETPLNGVVSVGLAF